jgi:AraC-like DNA-binding protein
MLKERIIFRDNLPVNLLVADIDSYPIHFHDELEVVFVLKGQILLRNGYYTYQLKPGDIFILNDRELHSFTRVGNEENMVMMFQLDLTYFSRYYENLNNNFFVTDMEDDDDESLDVLRKLLSRILIDILEKGSRYEQRVIESTHNLIASLQADFHYFVMEDGKFVNETKNKANKILAARLNRITDYMYDNYYRKLTLGEIANREHLSIYYLSHVIKEASGLSFQELLNFIRVEESEKLLLGTNKKLGTIAEETGFSALRYYIKHFEMWFHMHPTQYRKEFTGKVSGRESKAELRRCNPDEIELALRQLVPGLTGEYISSKTMGPTLVHLVGDVIHEPEAGTGLPDHFMTLEGLGEICVIYRTLMGLGERRIAVGDQYIITGKGTHAAGVEGASVLIVNISDEFMTKLENAESPEALYEIVADNQDEAEFLLRWDGLSGVYKITRYKMSRDNCLHVLQNAGEKGRRHNARENLLGKLSAMASVEFDELDCADTLSLRTTMKGFSWELILIDKKTAN